MWMDCDEFVEKGSLSDCWNWKLIYLFVGIER